jgi:uncharacterized protein YgiM (DUF1202 family)
MKKFKNKMTFLIFLLGFYAVIAVFTGVVMYLPYMATEEYYEDEETYEDEEDTYEDEESSEDEESYDDEESSGDEDTYEDEESSGDEDSYDEEESSEDEDSYDEESSEDEDTYEDESSDDEDSYDDESSEDEDTYEDESSEDEDTYDEEDTDDESANNSVPHTEDVEDGSHDDSVVVPTPISENTVNSTTSGTTQATTSVATISATSSKAQAASNPFPLSFSYNGKGKLNIRKEPSKSGKIVGTISTNTKGSILEFTNDDWAKVKYNNIEGYVAYEYIEYTLPEGAVIPSPKPSAMP